MFVAPITIVPTAAGVKVNVPVGVPALMLTVVGVNVPPALLVGVTTTVPVMLPLAPTVKFVDATPVTPVVGPVKVMAVAGGAAAEFTAMANASHAPEAVARKFIVPVVVL